jgi:hypothetical protein
MTPAAASQQAASTVSVVARTALRRAESRRRLETGFEVCLVKAFSAEELVETIVTFAHDRALSPPADSCENGSPKFRTLISPELTSLASLILIFLPPSSRSDSRRFPPR